MSKERLEEIKNVYEDYKELQKKRDFKQADIALLYLSENHIDWLIEQAKRVQELEDVNSQLERQAPGIELELLNMELTDALKQNKCYREALEFYANEEIYKENLITKAEYDADGICISNDDYAPPIIYFDSGEKARKALEGKE